MSSPAKSAKNCADLMKLITAAGRDGMTVPELCAALGRRASLCGLVQTGQIRQFGVRLSTDGKRKVPVWIAA